MRGVRPFMSSSNCFISGRVSGTGLGAFTESAARADATRFAINGSMTTASSFTKAFIEDSNMVPTERSMRERCNKLDCNAKNGPASQSKGFLLAKHGDHGRRANGVRGVRFRLLSVRGLQRQPLRNMQDGA